MGERGDKEKRQANRDKASRKYFSRQGGADAERSDCWQHLWSRRLDP